MPTYRAIYLYALQPHISALYTSSYNPENLYHNDKNNCANCPLIARCSCPQIIRGNTF
jgi:hypothetical protein